MSHRESRIRSWYFTDTVLLSELLKANVKIYQFAKGFIHAKCFVCDDEIATVGSINLDYRSLYLHYECGIYMYRSKAVRQVKEDVLNTIEQSKTISLGFCQNREWYVKGFTMSVAFVCTVVIGR